MNEPNPISTRLEELYKTFSLAEKRDLSRFIDSPYFNRDKNLLLLHEFLSNIEFNVPDLKLKAWRSVFKSERYNDKKFRYLISDLIARTEEFIFTESISRSKPGFARTLEQYFTARGASLNKRSLAEKMRNGKKVKRSILSPEYYLQKHYEDELVTESYMGSLKQYVKYITEHRNSEPSGLDVFYIIEKLRELCVVANDNNVFGVHVKSYYQNEILELAARSLFSKNPFVKAYLSVHHMLTTKDEQHYFVLKKLIDEHGYDFEDKHLAELFLYARNFCIGRINAGNHKFFSEIFDLYEQGLSKRVLLLNGEINEQNFKNIVTTGLRIGKHKWVFDFIHEYRYKLGKAVRENAFNYNLANYLFHTKQYAKALQSLQKVSLSDLFYGLDVRSLTIKCYYELDEQEAFFNAYESFRVFVTRRKNVSEQHRRNYLNFLRIAKKLMNLRPRDKKNIQNIQQEIKSQKALADKNWLEEKINFFAE